MDFMLNSELGPTWRRLLQVLSFVLTAASSFMGVTPVNVAPLYLSESRMVNYSVWCTIFR
ncbi:hypothetical protein D3C84_1297790 [compost metagenome]